MEKADRVHWRHRPHHEARQGLGPLRQPLAAQQITAISSRAVLAVQRCPTQSTLAMCLAESAGDQLKVLGLQHWL